MRRWFQRDVATTGTLRTFAAGAAWANLSGSDAQVAVFARHEPVRLAYWNIQPSFGAFVDRMMQRGVSEAAVCDSRSYFILLNVGDVEPSRFELCGRHLYLRPQHERSERSMAALVLLDNSL